ncbi:MAG TPA: DUF6776 family protein [Burkholderiales bacterium]|nr:DUF6776 family protein [Burkholderiales bacterium]HYA47908.1 DUF6776 family protein [Burkholderiales bacterium]
MARLLKQIRQRFGISAPRMTVQTHVAWYWRWLGMLVFLSLALALAAWMYDTGRRFAGFDRGELQSQLARLRESMSRLEDEAARLRAIANASESRLKIEQTAQAQLAAQVKTLEDENNRLKEDLAFFENVVPAERRGDKVSIHRFKVERDVLPGEYRYRLLVLQGGKLDREFHGSLQLVVEMQQDGRDATILLPEANDAGNAAFKLNFKYFRRVEGTFRVPAGAKVRTIQARILENGSGEARASQNVNLS